jgi:hypothetical protein
MALLIKLLLPVPPRATTSFPDVILFAVRFVMVFPAPIKEAPVILPPVTMSPVATPKRLLDVPAGVILFAILIKKDVF